MVNDTKAKMENLAFPEAMSCLLAGGQIARQGWNGSGMYLWLSDESIPFDSYLIRLEPSVVIFNADGLHQPGWCPSQSDMMADDWYIVEGDSE